MRHRYRMTIVVLALSPALLLTMAGKGGCDSAHVGPGPGGTLAVEWGDPPTDATVRPIGVGIQGKHIGEAAWVAAAAATGAGTGAIAAKAVQAVGGDPLELTGDPCQDKPGDHKVAAWRHSLMHPYVFLDCATWENVRHYSQARLKSIGVVVRCLSRVVRLATITRGVGEAAKYVWKFPAGGAGEIGGTATILTDQEGRITSAFVDGRWQSCAGVAP